MFTDLLDVILDHDFQVFDVLERLRLGQVHQGPVGALESVEQKLYKTLSVHWKPLTVITVNVISGLL